MLIVAINYKKEDFTISTSKEKLDPEMIYSFLKYSYWAKSLTWHQLKRSLEHSLCYGVYHGEQQIGFAWVVTDYSTFAYLADVFIIPQYQGKGLGKWMMDCVLKHPELQDLRRWLLKTSDAFGLYEKFGFEALSDPHKYMAKPGRL